MRRALLTGRGMPPFTVGNPAIDGASLPLASTLAVATENPAPTAGTIATVNLWPKASGQVRFVTGTLSGTTFTVHRVTGLIGVIAGAARSVAVNLPIPAGGLLGAWTEPSGSAALAYTSPGTFLYIGAVAAPTNGASYTASIQSGVRLSLQGVGT